MKSSLANHLRRRHFIISEGEESLNILRVVCRMYRKEIFNAKTIEIPLRRGRLDWY